VPVAINGLKYDQGKGNELRSARCPGGFHRRLTDGHWKGTEDQAVIPNIRTHFAKFC